jgi:hypothetical protein
MAIGAVPQASAAAATTDYVAVIDGGSSGTRLALFAKGSGVTVKKIFRSSASVPGLSSLVASPAKAGPTVVAPLLRDLEGYVRKEGIPVADVPVALLSTAGMRRVELNDPVAARKIFKSTRKAITESGFPLRANKILPDVREASLAWLDANVDAGTLNAPKRAIGTVEVGGASAQVAFRTTATSGPGVASVRVQGRRIGVVAVSYLGLGANEARDFMQEQAAGGAECFPNNPSGVDPAAFLAKSAMPVPSATARFRGPVCGQAYSSAIAEVTRETPRSVKPRNLSKLPGFAQARFIGLGGVPFTYRDLRVPRKANERTGLTSALQASCRGVDAWSKVRALYPTPTVFTETLCASGAYYRQLFFGPVGIGLDPDRFAAQPKFPKGEPSWSAGYAITALHP